MSLQMRSVTLTYPDGRDRLTALDKVDLTVEPGGFVAVTGPSGSGKSSLLAVAGALITPDSGSVTVAGTELAGLSRRERAKVRRDEIGFVFQSDNLIASLTAEQQLLAAAHLRGGRPSRHRGQARELLDQVGLADAADRRPHELSGGMRQRVNIARALMGEPRLLLIDEPTSALDSERSAAVIGLLGALVRERGVSAVLVSHDLESLAPGTENGVDRIVTVVDGRIERSADYMSAA